MVDNIVLDNHLLQKYHVTIYNKNTSNYDIINDFISQNNSEQAFYVIDLSKLIDAYNIWTSHLPDIIPYYAVKCNPNEGLLETLACLGTSTNVSAASTGVNFDCASEDELRKIIKITNDPSRIIFANPCKMMSQIRYARANDIDLMTFDCEEELYKIRVCHPYAKLILRLAVDETNSACKFNKKFGCHSDNIENLLIKAKAMELNIVGFSFHVGSGCISCVNYYNAIKTCYDAVLLAKKTDINITIIDIGGGFPGTNNEMFEEIAKNINSGIKDFFKDLNIKFIAEPGRFFAQRSHIMVLNIIGKKIYIDSDGNKNIIYYLNDGVYGAFNCIHYDHANISILPFNERDGQLYNSTIFGPTCDSIDLIVENINLPELVIGEWVYVEDFGAYTIAASSKFNGFECGNLKYIIRL